MTQKTNPLLGSATPEGKDVTFKSGSDDVAAYFARPSGAAAVPGVVVIHENRGLVPYLRDVADGLASHGYMAVAPDMLSREGGTASISDIPPVLSEIPRERHVADAQAAVRFLQEQGATKIGIIGFCFGGGVVWRTAVSTPDVTAAVPFYGANPPLEEVPNTKAAVFAVYGELDERINAGMDDILKALKDAGITHEHKVYPGAAHAFHNHTNPPDRYNEAQAKQAWSDALAWFDKHLKG